MSFERINHLMKNTTSYHCGHETAIELKSEKLILNVCKNCGRDFLNDDKRAIVMTRFEINRQLDFINSKITPENDLLDRVLELWKSNIEIIKKTLEDDYSIPSKKQNQVQKRRLERRKQSKSKGTINQRSTIKPPKISQIFKTNYTNQLLLSS